MRALDQSGTGHSAASEGTRPAVPVPDPFAAAPLCDQFDAVLVGLGGGAGRVAVRDASGASVSYAELGRLCAGGVGVDAARRPVAVLGGSAAALALAVAIVYGGSPLVLLDPQLPVDRLRHILAGSGACRTIVADGLEPLAREAGAPRVVTASESLAEAGAGPSGPRPQGGAPATIVYTSGSTGTPKGVELTHRNFAFLVLSALQYMPRAGAWPNRRLLLFLPLSHVFARFMEFFSFGGTISLALSSNMKTMVKDFETFGPTLLLAVPRVYEKVYNAASQRAGTGFAGKMFMRAAENAREWSKAEQKGEQLPIAGRIAHAFYEQVVYKKIRTIFGPNADFAITGGAPMDSELSHFFNGIGMPVLEGYGMTETCGPVCVSLPEDNRIGTIGMPMCGITAGIAEDGELVVKGPLGCKGYPTNPGVTAQQITDGWLHTGDLGDISEDGFISITGRKKDLIITAGGKNVSPGLLEASVMTSPVVNQCLVIGDKKPFVAALVTLDLADANNWLESQGAKPEPDLASLAKNAIVHAEVERAVNAANEGVSRAESIRKFEILPDEFTEANGMLTPSLKTRRAQIVEHYRELIDDVIYVPLKK